MANMLNDDSHSRAPVLPKSGVFVPLISGSHVITTDKLFGSQNYASWSASVELWFIGQGCEDRLTYSKDVILDAERKSL